jgi:hypothetical protein
MYVTSYQTCRCAKMKPERFAFAITRASKRFEPIISKWCYLYLLLQLDSTSCTVVWAAQE